MFIIKIFKLFYGCLSLKSLPEISKWNLINVINYNDLYNGKEQNLDSFILKDDKNNNNFIEINLKSYKSMTNMSHMFYFCKSLKYLPDISRWNTFNVKNMSYMFYNCSSLQSLPDISKWNTNKLKDVQGMFYGCKENLNIPSKFIN